MPRYLWSEFTGYCSWIGKQSGQIALIAVLTFVGWIALFPQGSFAAITIPNELNAETLGGSVLATSAPVVTAIITASVTLFLIGLAIRMAYRRVRGLAH